MYVAPGRGAAEWSQALAGHGFGLFDVAVALYPGVALRSKSYHFTAVREQWNEGVHLNAQKKT